MSDFTPEDYHAILLRVEAMLVFQASQIHTLQNAFLQLAASLNVTHSADGKTLEASLFRAAVSHAQGRLGALADDSPGLAAAPRRILDEHTRQPGEQSDSTE